jgi:toxin ParE1/3/4
MSRRVRFDLAARLELNEAADFYDLEGPGLGSVFLDAVERTLGQLREFPESAPIALGPARRRLVSGFPYAIVFSILDDAILVLAVAHHKRRPFYWKDRV